MKSIAIFFLTCAMLSAAPITQVKLVDAGNPAVIADDTYIGPYTLQVNGQIMPALCIDFNDDSIIGSSWNAYMTYIASGNFSSTYHAGDANVAQEYQEEAYLYSLIAQPNVSSQMRTAIQEAAWLITDPSFHPSDPGGAQGYLSLAQANYSSMDFSNFAILSSVGTPHDQEFLIYTPEPGSLLLFGTGLVLAGGLRWRRRKAATAKA